MKSLPDLFQNNKNWAEQMERLQPGFFSSLLAQQTPKYLWIGCSDSRVPANEITGLAPGEMFVHRNIANLVVHSDFNALSVIQYAVEHLHIEHIIVCGHYGCGGVKAALSGGQHGLVDNWLRHVKDIAFKHHAELQALDPTARVRRAVELNIEQQVANVCSTTIVQDAWASGKTLHVHGWVYDLADGLLRDLGLCHTGPEEVDMAYRMLNGSSDRGQ